MPSPPCAQNPEYRMRHGLRFEDEKTHLALLREAGFVQIEIQKAAGLRSNVLLSQPSRFTKHTDTINDNPLVQDAGAWFVVSPR
jgi:hypothetical protein